MDITQFYPTPSGIANKMVEPYSDLIKNGAIVLDPSAGTGSLLDVAKWKGNRGYDNKYPKMMAIEIDQERRRILKDKGFKVIGEDWLQYSSSYHFDIVIMNPPFNNGDDHLLLAWERLNSGHIACLLNARTYDHPYTAKRELLRDLIDRHGTVERLGNCFSFSDRETDVDVILVRLEKKAEPLFKLKSSESQFNFEAEEILESAPARNNILQSLLHSFSDIAGALKAEVNASLALNAVGQDFMKGFYTEERDRERIARIKYTDPAGYYNEMIGVYNRAAWHQVFNRVSSLRSLMTQKVLASFEKFMAESGEMEFNADNVNNLLEFLVINRNKILHDCVVDTFDAMCSYDPKNKIHWEGWKTNSAHRVNKKVILPYVISSWLSYSIRDHRKLSDIDRAMCAIVGMNYGDLSTPEAIKCKNGYTLNYALKTLVGAIEFDMRETKLGEGESEFFFWKWFKKGTVHLKFKDEKLWQEFNLQAAKGKNWLPDEDHQVKTRRNGKK